MDIDLDGTVSEDGTLAPLATELVELFASDTEISPSRGLHLIVRGTLPPGRLRNSALGLEVYDRGRCFTVTGETLDGPRTIRECPTELRGLRASAG